MRHRRIDVGALLYLDLGREHRIGPELNRYRLEDMHDAFLLGQDGGDRFLNLRVGRAADEQRLDAPADEHGDEDQHDADAHGTDGVVDGVTGNGGHDQETQREDQTYLRTDVLAEDDDELRGARMLEPLAERAITAH